MNQIILATHGGLADGMRDTLSMVLGDASNVHVVSLARDDKDPITSKVQALIDSFDPADKVYVCTDMLGSSVNNEMVALGASSWILGRLPEWSISTWLVITTSIFAGSTTWLMR